MASGCRSVAVFIACHPARTGGTGSADPAPLLVRARQARGNRAHQLLARAGAQRIEVPPPRLVLRAEDLRERQADSTELVMGPPVSAPTAAKAGRGNCKGCACPT
ncbi:hypothetical protein B4Q13_21050 [Lacticaseibacillus rhamnosus]